MVLLAERAQQGDLRSKKIEFGQLTHNRHQAARLLLDDGTWVDVCNDGHHELLVLKLPEAFHREVLSWLVAGYGGRDKIPADTDQLSFRIHRMHGGSGGVNGHQVEIGSTLIVKSYYREVFFCVFTLNRRITEVSFWTMSGYIPHQR